MKHAMLLITTLLVVISSPAQNKAASKRFTPAFSKAAIRAVIEMGSIDRQNHDMESSLGNRAVDERLHDAEAEAVTDVDQKGMVILKKGRQFFTSCSIVWTPDDGLKVARLADRCKQNLLTVFRTNTPDADTSHCGPISQLWKDEPK